MAEIINIRGVKFHNVDFEGAVAGLMENLDNGVQTALYTPNSEIVQQCIDDAAFREIVNSAEMIIPDGVGVIKAGRILGTPFRSGKVAGIEVGEEIVRRCAGTSHTIYLLGGKPGVAEAARDALSAKYPGVSFVGCTDGYFKKEGDENDAAIDKVNASGADVLFVCLGVPTQEKWIYANRSRLTSAKLMMALGGSLDGYAGIVKRAPKIFIRLGLEWFYRLCCEPWRFKRMLALPKFYFGTVLAKLKGKNE